MTDPRTPTPQRRLDARATTTPTLDEQALEAALRAYVIAPSRTCVSAAITAYLAALPSASAEPTGEAVAWQIFDRDGKACVRRPEVQQRVAEIMCQEFNATPEVAHQAPFTVAPLYAHPLPASPRREAVEATIDAFAESVIALCDAVHDGRGLIYDRKEKAALDACTALTAMLTGPAGPAGATAGEPWPEVTPDLIERLKARINRNVAEGDDDRADGNRRILAVLEYAVQARGGANG